MTRVKHNGDYLTRRRFLTTSGALATGLVFSDCATTAIYRTVVLNGRVEVNIDEHHELAQPGGIILLGVEGVRGAIVLVNAGQNFRALSSVCTHLGCNVRPSRHFLQCPCHGSTYDLEGNVVRGPAQRALQTFETHVSGNKVSIVVNG